MRMTSGGAFAWSGTTEAPTTSADAAPTAAGDGQSCLLGGLADMVADEWYVRMRVPATKDTTTITLVVWLLVGGFWDGGTLYTLKTTPDADGGMSMVLPGVGAATKVYLQVVSLDGSTPGVIVEAFHNEHSEAQ